MTDPDLKMLEGRPRKTEARRKNSELPLLLVLLVGEYRFLDDPEERGTDVVSTWCWEEKLVSRALTLTNLSLSSVVPL
jgi:hypothetical protein